MARLFKGRSTQSIADTNIDTLNSWDRRTLAAAVRRLADTANKRIKGFESKGIDSPAYLSAMRGGGNFSTRNKTLNQLRAEFIRAREFLRMKTSTQRGYQKVKEDFFDRVEASAAQKVFLSDDDLNKFWRLYDKTKTNVLPFVKGSPPAQKMVFDIFIKNMSKSDEDLIKEVYKRFDLYYEEEEEKQYTSTSDFYSL